MNNPSNMSNEDLEKDMEARNQDDAAETNKAQSDSTDEAEEVVPEEKTMDMGVDYEEDKEQDLDDLLHQQASLKQTGSMPDPETLSFREGQ